MQRNKKLIAAFFIILTSLTFVPKPAQAFFHNDILKPLLIRALREAVEAYIRRQVNKLQSRYKIKDYMNYGLNVKNQVHLLKTLEGEDDFSKVLYVSIIQDLDGNPVRKIPFRDWRQLATTAYSLDSPSPEILNNDLRVYNFLSGAGRLPSQPMGQKLTYFTKAMKKNTDSIRATEMQINQSSGLKDRIECGGNFVGPLTQSQRFNCAVKDPANYIGQQVQEKLAGYFNSTLSPKNEIVDIVISTGKLVANLLYGNNLFADANDLTLGDVARVLRVGSGGN